MEQGSGFNYRSWEEQVPQDIRNDVLWTVKAYRLALFTAELAWHDVTRLVRDHRTRGLADQLYRAVGSVSANLAEGYSRSSGRDRARFFEYALGSARESRGWYYKGRHVLQENVVLHRIRLLTETIRLLLVMIPQQRKIKEEPTTYSTAPIASPLDSLLTEIPFPTD